MTRWVLLVMIGCGSGQQGTGTTAGEGGGSSAPVITATSCADVRAKVEALYRADAQAKEPKRVDESVADNTAMVMRDCEAATATVVPCLARVQSVAELEKNCLVPLDEEGTEGER